MKRQVYFHLMAALAMVPLVSVAAEKIDFSLEVKPILESACLSCHGPEKPKGSLRRDTKAGALKGGENKGAALVPGNPDKSPLYASTILPANHEDIMPPKGNPLTKSQTEVLRAWIERGAVWPDGAQLAK